VLGKKNDVKSSLTQLAAGKILVEGKIEDKMFIFRGGCSGENRQMFLLASVCFSAGRITIVNF